MAGSLRVQLGLESRKGFLIPKKGHHLEIGPHQVALQFLGVVPEIFAATLTGPDSEGGLARSK